MVHRNFTTFMISSQKVLNLSNTSLGGSGIIITSGTKPDNLLPLSFLKKGNPPVQAGGFPSAHGTVAGAWGLRHKKLRRQPGRKFTIPLQKVLKSSNTFLWSPGIIIMSGTKPDNLLPLSFLKNESPPASAGGLSFFSWRMVAPNPMCLPPSRPSAPPSAPCAAPPPGWGQI